MSGAIGKRERTKKVIYNAEAYFREQDKKNEATMPKPVIIVKERRRKIPKPRTLPRGVVDRWKFYNADRLQEIREMEEKQFNEYFNMATADLPPEDPIKLLSDEVEAERTQLLNEGFGKWSAGAFAKFKTCCGICGRDDIKGIHERIEKRFKNITLEDTRAYARAFWENGPTVFSEEEWNKIEERTKAGEAKLQEIDQLMVSVSKKVMKTRGDGPFAVDRMIFLEKARKRFTHAEDAFLLCALHDHAE